MTLKKEQGENTQGNANAKKSVNKKPTVAELQDQVKKLTAQLQKKNNTLSLDEQIAYFEAKRTKIKHLDRFKASKNQLLEALLAISEAREEGKGSEKFDSENYSLSVNVYSNYGSGSEIVKISNDLIMIDVIEAVNSKIDEKIKVLESEILED